MALPLGGENKRLRVDCEPMVHDIILKVGDDNRVHTKCVMLSFQRNLLGKNPGVKIGLHGIEF